MNIVRTDIAQMILAAILVSSLTLVAVPQQASAMNKAELIDAIASEADITKADAKRSLDTFIDTTTKALKKGDRVTLVGFGSFSVDKRTSQQGDDDGDGFDESSQATVQFKTNTTGILTSNDCDDTHGSVPPDHLDADCDDDGLVTLEELKIEVVNVIMQNHDGSDEQRSRERVREFVDSFFDVFFETVHDQVATNEIVELGQEFGTFYPPTQYSNESKRSARKGRNPQTGKEIKIPAKKVVKFKPGSELADKVK